MHDGPRIFRPKRLKADRDDWSLKPQREPALPLNLPTLPYDCTNPTCGCTESTYDEQDCYVRLNPSSTGFKASIIDSYGMVIDVFRDYDAVRCLEKVHEAYPTARFGDPA